MTDDSTDAILLHTADGRALAGDLTVPAGVHAGAVLCHPHPAYGGDRRNIVVDALYRALPAAGVAALRFDFHGVTRAPADDDGPIERDDVVAALDRLAAVTARTVPLFLVGYSFGADVALSVGDDRHAGWVAVAPPLRFGGDPCPGTGDRRPALVLVPEHDQFSPPSRVAAATQRWPRVSLETVPMADHFLAGATAAVARAVTNWIAQQAGGPVTPDGP